MRKIKEVLRLEFEVGLGLQQIARSCSIGLGTLTTTCSEPKLLTSGGRGAGADYDGASLVGSQHTALQSGAPMPDLNVAADTSLTQLRRALRLRDVILYDGLGYLTGWSVARDHFQTGSFRRVCQAP